MLEIILACAPTVAADTMQWVIKLESNNDPLAININGPDGVVRLPRKPADAREAVALVSPYLDKPGYSVDIGLAQVNSRNFPRYRLTVEDAFDPCTNVSTGAAILTEAYSAAVMVYGSTPYALLAALSKYNTGSLTAGFKSGYVARYVAAWGTSPHVAASSRASSAATADTQISMDPDADFSHAKKADAHGSPDAVPVQQPSLTAQQEAKMADTQMHFPEEDHLPVVSGDPADFGRAGVHVELDEDEAADMGVTPETGLSFAAAWDSNSDNENSVPSLPVARVEATHGE